MLQRGLMWKVAVAVVLLLPTAAWSGDVEDLKASFEQAVGAISSRNVDALMPLIHNEAVYFFPSVPFPREGKAAIQQSYQMSFANNESMALRPINPQYRVIGATGLAWGHFALSSKPKDGPMTIAFTRYTWTYVKEGGKWLIVTFHGSRLPSGH